jgi:hypothetical protein
MLKLNVRMMVVIGFSLLAGACGKIPKAYRGQFVDSSTGFQMELKSSEGQWVKPDGSKQLFTAQAAAVEKLEQGQPGIYLRSIEGDELEVFWVNPVLASRRDEYGFISMEAEVIYTRLDAKASSPIAALAARHCEHGQVLIDRVSKSFNGGCPGDSRVLQFVRVPSKK